MKKEYIAVAASLAVVAFVFLNINPFRPAGEGRGGSRDVVEINLPEGDTSRPVINLPGRSTPTTAKTDGKAAFAVFKRYMEYARTHDLEGLRTVSHQISPICNDPSKQTECFTLMDNVYGFAKDFREIEFKNVYSDSRQIVLTSDFGPLPENAPEGSIPVRYALFFTKGTDGEPNVLGIKYCLADSPERQCFETDPSERDKDNDGWWDQVEEFFR